MVLCTDIKDNHIYQRTAKHPQVSLAENKASRRLSKLRLQPDDDVLVTGVQMIHCPASSESNEQNPHEDMDISTTV